MIAQLQYELGESAGENPVLDAKRSGYIKGLRTLVDTTWED